MLYPRGICLFPLLPPIPSFHKVSLFTGSSFKIASRRQSGGEGGGGSGGRRGEFPRSARFRSINQSINQSTLSKHGKWLSKLVFRHAV